MAKYLFCGKYVGDGVKGLLKDGGSIRYADVDKMVKSMGGTMQLFCWAFGEYDYFMIADLPDPLSAAAMSLTVSSTGRVTVKTTVLISAEEMDQVVKKSPIYKAPGQ